MQLTQPQRMEVPLICIQAHILSTTHSSTWLSRNCPKQRAHKTHAHSQQHHNIPYSLERVTLSCCRTAVGVGQRALSLRSHGGGTPPLLAPGRVTSPRHILEYDWYYCGVAATGSGWF
jgi:hypothetical protein